MMQKREIRVVVHRKDLHMMILAFLCVVDGSGALCECIIIVVHPDIQFYNAAYTHIILLCSSSTTLCLRTAMTSSRRTGTP